MHLAPEAIRSIHKIGPVRLITIPVNVAIFMVAFLASGPPAAIVAFFGMQLFWIGYATVLPDYLIKKMDGSDLVVKRGRVATHDMNELMRSVNA